MVKRTLALVLLALVAGCSEPPRNIEMEKKCEEMGGQVENWRIVDLHGRWSGAMVCAKKGSSEITDDSRRYLFFWP